MTTDEALERLRPDWVLSRGKDYRTGEVRWSVNLIEYVDAYEWLGHGATVAEAIEAAEIKAAQAERERAERDADYARRKAAGELTPLERASEHAGAIWGAEMLAAVKTPSVLLGLVNRSCEADMHFGTVVKVAQSDEDAG